MASVGFRHGALSDPYEQQANEQGYTLGDEAEFFQKLGKGLIMARLHRLLTDSQYDQALRKLTNKLAKACKPLEE